jgi:hypothetical protein
VFVSDVRDRRPTRPDLRGALRADCARCVGLCCVVPPFVKSADFAISKPAGRPCPNLRSDHACVIHDRLRPAGFPGCAAYDCFGAGPKVAGMLDGADWRISADVRERLTRVFPIMRDLHELLWFLADAMTWVPDPSLDEELSVAFVRMSELTDGDAASIERLDIEAHRRTANALLVGASGLARAGSRSVAVDHHGGDLIGRNLAGADLSGANLAGAFLIGADLRRSDLRRADVRGADFRAADVRGARLDGALFLTQSQIDAARGDTATCLAADRQRPEHWLAA